MYLHCLDPGEYHDTAGRRLDRAALRSLATSVQPKALVLVLPLRRCMVDELALAANETKHLARALPWRFEEQLAEPADALHFATSPLQDGRVRVTAVSRTWLHSILDDLAAAGVLPGAAVCESELVPWRDQEWTLWVPRQAAGSAPAILRHGWHRALLCQPGNARAILQALADEQAALPQRILLCAEAGQVEAWRELLPQAMQGQVAVAPLSQVELPVDSCNVLQGSFAPRLPWARWWREWRVAAVLLLALLLGEAGVTAAEAWRLAGSNRELQAGIRQVAAAALPGGEIVDPLLQLRRAVAAAGGSERSGMLALLTRMAPALSGNAELRVQGMEYSQDSGELQLLLESSGFAAVERLRASLQAQGLQAELLGSTSDGSVSRSRLRIRA